MTLTDDQRAARVADTQQARSARDRTPAHTLKNSDLVYRCGCRVKESFAVSVACWRHAVGRRISEQAMVQLPREFVDLARQLGVGA